MSKVSRRQLLNTGLASLSALAVGDLILRAEAKATEESGDIGDYGKYLAEPKQKKTAAPSEKAWVPTEDNILGPFYRPGSPFRAKITPPLEPGTVVVISGRVWALDSRKPLSDVVLDIWQASSSGRYDNDDPSKPPAKGVFLNRARLVTDENGYYEFESVHPGRYKIGPQTWRPSHIHYMVRHPKYKPLVTQLYFQGDPHNATDQFIKQSLIISVQQQKTAHGSYEAGRFDIVLAPLTKAKGRDLLIRPLA